MENKRYELMVMLKPDQTQKQTESELKNIRGFISAEKGNILFEDIWGTRKLAYKVKKFDYAYYAIFYFEIPGAGLKELNQNLRLENNIMRHMILSIPADYELKAFAPIDFEEVVLPKYEPKKSIEEAPAEVKDDAKAKKTAAKKPTKTKAVAEDESPAKDKDKGKEKEEAKKPADKHEAIENKLEDIINDPDNMNL